MTTLEALAATELCYLTTRGRRTGRPHRIEIWFVAHGGGAYLLSGSGASDWLRNVSVDPRVVLEIAGERRDTVAQPVDADDPANDVVRAAMVAKYQAGYGSDLRTWSQTGWLVRVDWPG